MPNRRRFLQSAITLSAVSMPAISAWPAGARSAEAPILRLERFVFDNRFPEAVEVAQHAAHRQVRLAEISGDLTALWYEDLDLLWKNAPMVLGGVTTRHGLFVLETLAADRGMRVVYRGEHAAPQQGTAAHSLSGPADLLARAASEPNASLWAPLARAMTQCPAGPWEPAHLELATPIEHASTRNEPLLSWIIAPRSSTTPLI